MNGNALSFLFKENSKIAHNKKGISGNKNVGFIGNVIASIYKRWVACNAVTIKAVLKPKYFLTTQKDTTSDAELIKK